jgi:hypothetical protein
MKKNNGLLEWTFKRGVRGEIPALTRQLMDL